METFMISAINRRELSNEGVLTHTMDHQSQTITAIIFRETCLLTLNLLFGTDKAEACAQITRAFNAYDNWTLLECKIECCTGRDCNNESVTINSTTILCK